MKPWRIERDSTGLWTFWFDCPGTRQNTLGTATWDDLDEALSLVEADASARLLLLRSAKSRGFCAGADLKELATFTTADQAMAFARLGSNVLNRLARLAPPTVAVIGGYCLGGGLELALACRYRIGCPTDLEPILGTPEVTLGLIPGWGGISRLPRVTGLRPALELLLSGKTVAAREARALGLLDLETTPEELDQTLEALPVPHRADWPPADAMECLAAARQTNVTGSPFAYARSRLLDVLEIDLSEGLDAALEAAAIGLADTILSPDGKRGIAGFLQR